MHVQQLKGRIVKGNICCICKNQYQNSNFQPSETLYFKRSSLGYNNTVDSEYEIMSNALSVNSA